LSRLVAPLIVMLAIAVVGVGCGDDEESSGAEGSASSLSEAEYVERANAVCSRSKQRLLKEMGEFTPTRVKENPGKITPAATTFAESFRVVGLPAIERHVEELRGLGLPSDDEDDADAVVVAMERAVRAAKQDPPISDAAFLQQFNASAELARDYGIGACAFG